MSNGGAMSSPPAFLLAAGLVAIAGCFFATQDAIAKSLTARYSPFQVLWIRLALHALYVGLWLTARGQGNYFRTRRPLLQVTRAVVMVFISGSMYWAVSLMPLAKATVIQFVSPIIVTLLSVAFLGERIGWRRATAIVTGFLGVVIVLAPDFGDFSPSMLLPLVTAVSLAVFVLLTKELSDPGEALPAFGLMPALSALLVLPVMPFVWQAVTAGDGLIFMVMALCGTGAHICLQTGLARAPASSLSPYLNMQVLCAAALSILFFADPLGLNFFAGAACIIGSGVAIWWLEQRDTLRPAAGTLCPSSRSNGAHR